MTEIYFDWDEWNIQKNEQKHGISPLEAETAFFDPSVVIFEDIKHSDKEQRWIAYGRSSYHQILMVAFVIRNKSIRIISVRRASRKERDVYEEKK